MSVHLFGVRHHGPGCARTLRAALAALAPDIVLVEGPPDAHDILPLMAQATMRPPVALLLYAPDEPGKAVYYPFARFSPEWQALDYALGAGVPARFIDLPVAIRFARAPALPAIAPAAPADAPEAAPADAPADASQAAEEPETPAETAAELAREDPLALLAQAAGYDDHELWWERQIEQRRDMVGFFEGILEAMQALRPDAQPRDDEEALREAQMRQGIRQAQREGYQRIAVVTGAWHSPALVNLEDAPYDARGDAALLGKLKRAKVQATWIPWANARLAARSGYGAGVTSPGWYEHLWQWPDGSPTRWLTRVARLLRENGIDASSASVIEATRLSEALAALRELPMPGLAELREAAQTTLCHGDPTRMQLIHDALEVGAQLGAVPPETPTTPLQRDVDALQRRLRLPASSEQRQLDLDLRKDTDRARSHLLRRLQLLGVPWGEVQRVYGAAGTFHELWRIQWQVEFPALLIEANIWGNTVAQASAARSLARADGLRDLPALTALLDLLLPAALPNATAHTLALIRSRAAVTGDVRLLMDALPPLANVVRYTGVLGVRAEDILPVYIALFERALIGLPGACAALDDDAARALTASIERTHDSVLLLDNGARRDEWIETLRKVIALEQAHGLVRGRCCRLLLDLAALDEAELNRLARLALAPVNPAAQAAAWVEGVIKGGALMLLHQDALWQALDAWLCDLTPEDFVATLPLLRRSFAPFDSAERQQMGAKVRWLRGAGGGAMPGAAMGATATRVQPERAALTLPTLARMLSGASGARGARGARGEGGVE